MKKTRKTTRPERKPYRFTLLMDKEKELIDYLDSFPKPLRGRAIVEALKLQMKILTQREQGEKMRSREKIDPEFRGAINL